MSVRSVNESLGSAGGHKSMPIIAAMGDKGGVGHSFAARIATGMLRETGYSPVGIDADLRNPHLARFYGNSMQVHHASIRNVEGWSDIYAKWDATPGNQPIVVDLPGNVGDQLEFGMERLLIMADRMNRALISVWVAAEEEDSIRLFDRTKQIAPASLTLFVLNGRFAPDPASFELWRESNTRARFLAEGGTETFMPVLPIRPRTAIARARCPFDNVSAAGLTLPEQVDFEIWWAAAKAAFAPLLAMVRSVS